MAFIEILSYIVEYMKFSKKNRHFSILTNGKKNFLVRFAKK